MRKKLLCIFALIIASFVLCMSAFAAEVRWKSVVAVSPTISAADQSYSSYIVAVPETSKMVCTLVLYEKGFWGNYTEVSRSSSTYYGFRNEFSGTYAVEAGKTYKLTTTVVVTANGQSETVNYDFEKKC